MQAEPNPPETDDPRPYSPPLETVLTSQRSETLPPLTTSGPLLTVPVVSDEDNQESRLRQSIDRFIFILYVSYIVVAVVAIAALASLYTTPSSTVPVSTICLGFMLFMATFGIILADIKLNEFGLDKVFHTYLPLITLGIYSLGFGLSIYKGNRTIYYCSGVIGAFSISIVRMLFTCKKQYEGETLIKGFKVLFLLSLMLLLINICMSADGIIKWSYPVVLFPFWIIFSIVAIFSVAVLISWIIAAIPCFRCKDIDCRKLIFQTWLLLNVLALTTFMPLIQLEAVKLLQNTVSADQSYITKALYWLCIVIVVMIMFTTITLSLIM